MYQSPRPQVTCKCTNTIQHSDLPSASVTCIHGREGKGREDKTKTDSPFRTAVPPYCTVLCCTVLYLLLALSRPEVCEMQTGWDHLDSLELWPGLAERARASGHGVQYYRVYQLNSQKVCDEPIVCMKGDPEESERQAKENAA